MSSVSTRGATIYFADSGAGPPVILAHSYLCSGEMWSPVLPALEESHRTINVDLRGHGRSSPIERAITLYDLLSDCLAVLDDLHIQTAVWAGLSIGGMIALRAALVAPERVSALILLDTDASAESNARRLQFGAMSLATRAVGLGPLAPEICRRMFGRTTRELRPALVDEWRKRFAAAHAPSMRRCLEALNRRDSLLDQLGRITVPSLVLVGDEDVSLPPSRSREIDAALPNSRLDVIPRAGHLCTLEQPEAVAGAIAAFLRTSKAEHRGEHAGDAPAALRS